MASKKKQLAKPIHEILEEIGIILSEEAIKVVELLEGKDEVTEDQIAKKFSLRVNDTRRILYTLSERGIATYEKSRDPKKKWWYIYKWSLDRRHIHTLLVNRKMMDLEKLQKLLFEEQEFVFECKKCKVKMTYSEALDNDYTCVNCGEVLTEIKSSTEERRLKKEISDIEMEIVALHTSRASPPKKEKEEKPAPKKAQKSKAKPADKKPVKKKVKPKKKVVKKKEKK